MNKKKRSPNYTFKEKENLLTIIAKYQSVIECKKTGAFYIGQKREAWKSITREFNSLCTTGPRNENMLKHFYNNIKHRSRKDLSNENKQGYLASISKEKPIVKDEPQLNNQTEQHYETIVNEDNILKAKENLIKELKTKQADEQRNIQKIGGGSFTPTLTDTGHQILSVLDSPDKNPDDAEVIKESTEECNSSLNIKTLPEFNQLQDANPVLESNPIPVIKRKLKHIVSQQKNICNKLSFPRLKHSAEVLKRIYFKKKIEIAYYQKENEMQKFRFEKEKNQLEIQILKKQLAKLY